MSSLQVTRPVLEDPTATSASGRTGVPASERGAFELSPDMRAELLDPEGWRKILEQYARTMRLGVALTDPRGNLLGTCHNPQTIWQMARDERPPAPEQCSFCLAPHVPCTAVTEALQTERVVLVRDDVGLAHAAVPLTLGNHRLGALIAGQVFDRYPEPLPLQRVARNFGLPPQQLWREALQRTPVSRATLRVYGDLLASLGQAFLRQRYAAILDRKLAETNQRYRLIIDGVKDYGLFTVATQGRVTSWNKGAERLLGYAESEIVGRHFSTFFTPQDVQNGVPAQMLENAGREGSIEDEGWRVRKDGTRFYSNGVTAALGEGASREFGKLIRDVTERRQGEIALLQAQKMESIGVLASGIAHDFNNLLTGIQAGVDYAENSLPPEHTAQPMLAIAAESSEMAANLTNQLLAYAGKGKFFISQFDLSALVAGMLQLLETSIPNKVQLRLSAPADLPWIEADASQIQQIVMNLVINAADAIGPDGGTVWVLTGVASRAEGQEKQMERDVYLEVKDSGSGMTEATKLKIFDPFFTTKFTGRGLGLAAVSGIVRAHKGRMQVESVPREGSTFRVYFPALVEHSMSAEDVPASIDMRGSGMILVVDDEPLLRKTAQMVLEGLGYSVLLAENGREALAIFRRKAGNISAVLLDMTMPVMGGEEAFHLIREIRADIPIVFTSGYAECVAREQFGADILADFIQKPYTGAKLGEKFNAILQRRVR